MSVVQHNCPSCSHEMDYLIASRKLVCNSCGHEDEIAPPLRPDAHLEKYDYDTFGDDNKPEYENVEVDCHKCSGHFVLPHFTISMDCPYCGTNTVVDFSKRKYALKPTGIIPFKVTKEELIEAALQQLKLTNPLVSPEVVRQMFNEGVHGIYLPAYSFDYTFVVNYWGEKGIKHSYKDSEGQRHSRTSWKDVSGQVTVNANDVAFVHSQYHSPLVIDSEELVNLVGFNEKYLSGFPAEGYSVPLHDSLELSRQMMEPVIESSIEESIGGDGQKITSYEGEYQDLYFSHFLYPAWVGNYTIKGKKQVFLASGLDGTVQMQVPIYPRRLWFNICLFNFIYCIPVTFIWWFCKPTFSFLVVYTVVTIFGGFLFWMWYYSLLKLWGAFSGVYTLGTSPSPMANVNFEKLMTFTEVAKSSRATAPAVDQSKESNDDTSPPHAGS